MQAVLSGGHHISASFTQDPGIFIISQADTFHKQAFS